MKFGMLPLLVALHGLAGAALAQGLSPLVQKPIDEFERFKAATLKDVETKLAAKREATIRDLEGRIIGETRAGNLNGAMAIKAKIETLKREAGGVVGGSARPDGSAHLAVVDFEKEFIGWTRTTPAMTAVPQAAKSGKLGLHYDDPATVKNTAFGPRVPVPGNREVNLRFWTRVMKGEVRVGLQCYDSASQSLGVIGAKSIDAFPEGRWREETISGRTPANARSIQLWMLSNIGKPGTADFDDFILDLAK